jgi:hypothetical protein
MGDLIPACPECDSSSLRNRTGKRDGVATPNRRQCGDCHATFDEPVWREPHCDQDINSELGQALLDYDCEVNYVAD